MTKKMDFLLKNQSVEFYKGSEIWVNYMKQVYASFYKNQIKLSQSIRFYLGSV